MIGSFPSGIFWPWTEASIPITEVDSKRAQAAGEHIYPFTKENGLIKQGTLRLSGWSLCDALVRSATTVEPGRMERVLTGISNWMKLAPLLRVDGGQVCLDAVALSKRRDSAWTSLAGELGQAFCWLVGIKTLKYRQIVDFGTGCQIVGRKAPGSSDKRNDFMCLRDGDVRLHLLESKGHLVPNNQTLPTWKVDLRTGLDQCDAGRIRLAGLAVGASHAVSTALHPAGSGETSRIVLADPAGENGGPADPGSLGRIARLHYAAWASAAGAFALSRVLLTGDTVASVAGIRFRWSGRDYIAPLFDAGVPGDNYLNGRPLRYFADSTPMCRAVEIGLLRLLLRAPDQLQGYREYPEPRVDVKTMPSEVAMDGTLLVSEEALRGGERIVFSDLQ